MKTASDSATDPNRVLVVEDAVEFRQLVASLLAKENFNVEVAQDGEQAVERARAFAPDVIVLDLMLPGIDGIEACQQIRTFTDAYVIMLTAKSAEVDKLIGLSVGADDYMTKPFSGRELVARIRTMLRRPRAPVSGEPTRRIGDLHIDVPAREVRLSGKPLELTRTEFDLLDALSENPRITFTRSQLLDRIWGPNWFGDQHVLDVHISNLRRKIEDDPDAPSYIRTVRGVGYRIAEG